MSNLTTVENWVGCPTTPLTKLLVASASYSEPKIFHFLVLVRNCETWVSRELRSLGYRVTATDAVAELVEASRQANSADEYAIADGKDLPFTDGRFDLVWLTMS